MEKKIRTMTDEEICERYKRGKRTVEIGEAAGISARDARKVLIKHDEPRRKRGAMRKYSVNEGLFKILE